MIGEFVRTVLLITILFLYRSSRIFPDSSRIYYKLLKVALFSNCQVFRRLVAFPDRKRGCRTCHRTGRMLGSTLSSAQPPQLLLPPPACVYSSADSTEGAAPSVVRTTVYSSICSLNPGQTLQQQAVMSSIRKDFSFPLPSPAYSSPACWRYLHLCVRTSRCSMSLIR